MGIFSIDSLEGIGGLITSVREAITGKRIVDPVELAKIDLQLEELSLAVVKGQVSINLQEAKHTSIFVAGWRPFIGWVSGIALFLMYIPKAILMTTVWGIQCFEILSTAEEVSKIVLPTFPELGALDVLGLVASMLGLGGLRTVEKFKGIERNSLRN